MRMGNRQQVRLLSSPSWLGLWCAFVAPFFFGGLLALAASIALLLPLSLRPVPFLLVPASFGLLLGYRPGSWPIVLCLVGFVWWAIFAVLSFALSFDQTFTANEKWVLFMLPVAIAGLFLLGVGIRRRVDAWRTIKI